MTAKGKEGGSALRPSDVGRLEISFDFELGWGAIENGLWKVREANGVYRGLRSILPRLLKQLEVMEVPVAWATVGAMIDAPKRRDFDHLPESLRDVVRSAVRTGEVGTFDGRDLFELVEHSNGGHQVAGHSYSHTRFSFPGVDGRFVTEEMERSGRAFFSWSEHPSFFVFPVNHEGFYEVLRDASYRSVRGAPAFPSGSPPEGGLQKVLRMLADVPPMSRENTVSGMRRITGSMFFKSAGGRPYALPLPYLRARRGLDFAIRNNQVLHIWIHPFNFSEVNMLFALFIRFLKAACRARDAGKLEIRAPGT